MRLSHTGAQQTKKVVQSSQSTADASQGDSVNTQAAEAHRHKKIDRKKALLKEKRAQLERSKPFLISDVLHGFSAKQEPAKNVSCDGTSPKRILVVSQHFWPENFRINDIVKGFMEDGIEVDVLCGLPNYPDGEWFDGYSYTAPRRQEWQGANVFRAGEIRRKNNTSPRIFLNYVSFPLYSLFSLPRLRGRKYDAVFCFNTSPVLMALPAIMYSKLHNVPLTTYVMDLWPENLYSVLPVKNTLLRNIAQSTSEWFYRRPQRLIALSEGMAQKLRTITSDIKNPPEIAVIPQYCEDFYDEPECDPAVSKLFKGHFNILFAGNISPAQDLENFVNAMEIVRKSPDAQDVRAVILGEGMSCDTIKQLVAKKGLSDAFLFCPPVPATDVPAWSYAADGLFAGLAKSEDLGLTLPGKIPSYLASSRPLIVAMDGEGARVAKESGAAFVSEAGDAVALAKNIISLRTCTPYRRKEMGEAGHAYYLRHFNRYDVLRALKSFILDGTT